MQVLKMVIDPEYEKPISLQMSSPQTSIIRDDLRLTALLRQISGLLASAAEPLASGKQVLEENPGL